MDNLSEKKCLPCEGKAAAVSKERISELMPQLQGWSVDTQLQSIARRFEFKSFSKTLAFVNAIGWIAIQEGHHPDIQFGFNYCLVHYSTHAAQGLTENDFICAAKIDKLIA